jgi:hypothetical protein
MGHVAILSLIPDLNFQLFLFPVFFMVQEMFEAAENELEEWVAVVYGCVLIGYDPIVTLPCSYVSFANNEPSSLFTTSTIFHTISYIWQKRYNRSHLATDMH